MSKKESDLRFFFFLWLRLFLHLSFACTLYDVPKPKTISVVFACHLAFYLFLFYAIGVAKLLRLLTLLSVGLVGRQRRKKWRSLWTIT